MSTIQLHPEYAWRNEGLSSNQAKGSASRNFTQKTNEKVSEKRAADEPKLSFLLDNPFFSFRKKMKEEKSLWVGIFNDVFKNIPKLLTGSLLTDVVKSLYKNADLTWQQAITMNLIDNGPSRIVNDVINSIAVRFLNGNHSFFNIFALPYIAPELSSQILCPILVTLMRALTAESNVDSGSAKDNMSKEQEQLLKDIQSHDRWFFRMVDHLSGDTMDKVKPFINKFLSLIGIEAGKKLKDLDGDFVYERDENGEIKIDKRKSVPTVLESNPQINKGLLGGIIAGSYLGSFLLPKHTAAFGFEEAKTLPRMLISTITTTLFRINTTMLHHATGMHRTAGANFDSCYRTSLVAKLLVPFTQYLSDALGTFLSTAIPINGSVLSTTLRLITEIPATFLSNGLINIAKKDRVDDDWTYLAHRFWKPIVDIAETTFKPLFATVCKFYGYTLGAFDPRIPNMYGVDIRTEETKAKEKLPERIQEKYKDSNIVSDLFLFAKKVLETPLELGRLMKHELGPHAQEVEEHIQTTVDNRNNNIRLRKEAEAALEKLAATGIEPKTNKPEVNRAILEIISNSPRDQVAGRLKELIKLSREKAAAETIESKAEIKEEIQPKAINQKAMALSA